jgi:hypothetical protein
MFSTADRTLLNALVPVLPHPLPPGSSYTSSARCAEQHRLTPHDVVSQAPYILVPNDLAYCLRGDARQVQRCCFTFPGRVARDRARFAALSDCRLARQYPAVQFYRVRLHLLPPAAACRANCSAAGTRYIYYLRNTIQGSDAHK